AGWLAGIPGRPSGVVGHARHGRRRRAGDCACAPALIALFNFHSSPVVWWPMAFDYAKISGPKQRANVLLRTRNLKMARNAHAYVRGTTVKFYEWLRHERRQLPAEPSVERWRHCGLLMLVRIVET